MRTTNKGLLVGIPIIMAICLVSCAAIFGGIELAFASLGAIVLIGITGIGTYTILFKWFRFSRISLRLQRLAGDNNCSRIAMEAPVSKKDTRIIMRHIDEIFTAGREQDEGKLVKVRPVSRRDKRIIIRNIDKLFFATGKQSRGATFNTQPVSQDDKRKIMTHIDELFTIGKEHSGERAQ